MMKSRISTTSMSRDEWLEHRRDSIGGSDAAAIIGLNPFSSPYAVWADKLGMIPPAEETEAMRLGHDLEEYVAKRFCEATGKRVRRENAILYNAEYPFAHANVDRMVIGENAGLECKTTSSLNLRRFKNGQFPDTYYVQCMHYMMVTGCDKWYLAVLVLGKEFLWFEINRDEQEIKALAEEEEAFWYCVISEKPPAVDGKNSTSEAITRLYPNSDGSEVDLTGFSADLRKYKTLYAQKKEIELLMDGIGNKIKQYMQNAETGFASDYSVKWSAQERRTFDVKAFASAHPEIALDPFYKTSKFRKFDIKERKEG